MQDIPFEMTLLPVQLRATFTGLLPEATAGNAQDRERNFMSRALAAFLVHKKIGCSPIEAAAAVVDGGGDGGIDAIHYEPTTHRLWVLQSKYIADGHGEPALGDVSKFKNGVEALLQGHFEAFAGNAALAARLPQIRGYFESENLQVRAALVYSGVNTVSPDRIRLLEDLRQRFSAGTDYFTASTYNLTTIGDWLTGADIAPGVDVVRLILLKPGWVLEPYETIYGLVALDHIAALYTQHRKRLVAANIRYYKGTTDVNDRIMETVRTEPQHMFYLNNGLTAYCSRLEVNNLDRGNTDEKRITAYDFSVVNGAQTIGAIARAFGIAPPPAAPGHVFLKIISLARAEDDRAFAQRITQSTNFQNQIASRDFVALDDQQERIARQLQLAGIGYHYKDAEDAPDADESHFDLVEATTALACRIQETECDLLARVWADRKSLWSFDEVYPEGLPERTRYGRLFPAGVSPRLIWRAVQTQRVVLDQLRNSARAEVGIRKIYFETVRWLVLNLIFLRLHPDQGDTLALTADEQTTIRTRTDELAETIWTEAEAIGLVTRAPAGTDPFQQPRHFRSVFSNSEDCRRLRNGTLARLAQRPAAPVAAAGPD